MRRSEDLRLPEEPNYPERASRHTLKMDGVSAGFGSLQVLDKVSLTFEPGVTAMIGPSGSGKSTALRLLNRMHEMTPGANMSGKVTLDDINIYDSSVNPVDVRTIVGMVFQKPNPFPQSIYDNVAYGPKIHKMDHIPDRVQEALEQAHLWKEVKNRLKSSGLELSGGQQQRLCIARAIAAGQQAFLMDEPCSALDRRATAKIEDLILELGEKQTIVIVTHNLAQAARVSTRTAFFDKDFDSDDEGDDGGNGVGRLIQVGPTDVMFQNPGNSRTEDFITGRFG